MTWTTYLFSRIKVVHNNNIVSQVSRKGSNIEKKSSQWKYKSKPVCEHRTAVIGMR